MPTLAICNVFNIIASLFFLTLFIPTAHASSLTPGSGDIEFTTVTSDGIENHKASDHTVKSTTTFLGLHLASNAQITINGIIATIEIEQQFKNPSEHWAEAHYTFPLPENAAVNHMEMKIGERVITASIKEKNEAKKIYDTAKSEGRKAALLQQHRPNVFSQRVSNIAPNESISVTLRYTQNIEYFHDQFSLRFPMTMTPRYTPQNNIPSAESSNNQSISTDDDSNWAFSQQQYISTQTTTSKNNTNNSLINTAINPIEISVQLNAGFPLGSIESDYHDISISKNKAKHVISLSKQTVSMDRDFILRWKPTLSNQPTAAIFNETIDNKHYGLVMLLPPKMNLTNYKPIPKNMIFILDTSGSMGGTSIQQAKSSLRFALKKLNSNDSFNIIEFNSETTNLSPISLPATSNNINKALRFVNKLEAGGGTEIKPAFESAFLQAKQSKINNRNEKLTQIIFITDGSVSNESELFNLIHNKLGQARLFTIGIGSAPNSFFMRKSAQFGGGNFTYIGDTAEVQEKMESLFNQIMHPMMRDISIHTNNGQIAEIYPSPIPDLYHGQPLIAAFRNHSDIDSITINATFEQQPWQQKVNILSNNQDTGVSLLWSRKKIESLLDEMRISDNEAEKENLKTKVTQLALKSQLLSPYTSFVAVEKAISRPTDESLTKENIPNALPAGQVDQKISYPKTATSLWMNIILGLLGMFFILLAFPKHAHQKA